MNKSPYLFEFNFSECPKDSTNNNDYIIQQKAGYGHLFILSDGIGVSGGADIASQVSAIAVKDYFELHHHEMNVSELIRRGINHANQELIQYVVSKKYLSGIGASIVIGILKKDVLYYSIIGNSKLYSVRNNQIELIESHYNRNMNKDVKYLGNSTLNQIEVRSLKVYQDDLFFFCSHSFSLYMTRIELLKFTSIFQFDNLKINLLNLLRNREIQDDVSVISFKINTGIKKVIPIVEDKYSKLKFIISLIVFSFSLLFFLITFLPILLKNYSFTSFLMNLLKV